jgi:uncharacterized protein Yka (UPF0111/DUF47 family)
MSNTIPGALDNVTEALDKIADSLSDVAGAIRTIDGNPTDDEGRNIVDAMFAVSYQLKNLGNADAATPMGAIEALGKVIMESNSSIADAINNLADAVREKA